MIRSRCISSPLLHLYSLFDPLFADKEMQKRIMYLPMWIWISGLYSPYTDFVNGRIRLIRKQNIFEWHSFRFVQNASHVYLI
jgi:hypothetical protein